MAAPETVAIIPVEEMRDLHATHAANCATILCDGTPTLPLS
ncbi:hypothetical protein RKLH11_2527 [Rhodobacteraceae bacterium KLH11]|nr:hypothetical protein RKLH11_2527 [Rhodobacteraceae bacterium KLH11]